MADLRTDWVDNIGMQVNAAFLNSLGGKVNAITGIGGVQSIASSATPSVDAATTRQLSITALATNITGISVSNAYDGHRLVIRIKDNGTARTVDLGASFRSQGFWLPTATTPTRTIYLECVYNAADSMYDVVRAHNPQASAFSAVGAGFQTHNTSFSFSHTAKAGDGVIVDVIIDRAVNSPTATYTPTGGSALPMTLLAQVNLNGTNGSNGVFMRFALASAPEGAATVLINHGATAPTADGWGVAQATSYQNVSKFGPTTTTRGSSSSPSQSVTFTDGLIAETLATSGVSATRTRGGGTFRWGGAVNNGVDANLTLDVATANATTTFSITESKTWWAGISTILL